MEWKEEKSSLQLQIHEEEDIITKMKNKNETLVLNNKTLRNDLDTIRKEKIG